MRAGARPAGWRSEPRFAAQVPLVPAAVACLLTATTSGAAVLVTDHLQNGLGTSAATTGAMFLPCSACVMVGSLVAPRVIGRRGRRVTIVAASSSSLWTCPSSRAAASRPDPV